MSVSRGNSSARFQLACWQFRIGRARNLGARPMVICDLARCLPQLRNPAYLLTETGIASPARGGASGARGDVTFGVAWPRQVGLLQAEISEGSEFLALPPGRGRPGFHELLCGFEKELLPEPQRIAPGAPKNCSWSQENCCWSPGRPRPGGSVTSLRVPAIKDLAHQSL